MKKERTKGFITGCLVSLVVVGLGITACATTSRPSATTSRTITVNDLQLTVDGTKFVPRSSTGEQMEIFSYNGTTYVPARAFAELIGLEVDYDASTQTAIITTPADSGCETSKHIGETRAKEIALNHAGVTESGVTRLSVGLDRDDGVTVYDVEFYVSNREYDYEIDALTGDVRSYDWDNDYNTPSTNTPSTGTNIGEDKAKEIALNHAGISASDVTFIKVTLDRDDGRMVYDVEFFTVNREYDYEIDATTGNILGFDYDAEYMRPTPSTTPTTPSNYITADQAKEIALQRASGATVVKCELDHDDGRAVYEIELREGRIEYDCEIDAISGTVLKWDVDYD